MFIVRLTTCLMLLMTLNQHGLGIRSQNVTILKQASNQASTNERLRPTHHQHYSAQTEYVKSNKTKYKIPSSKINSIYKKNKQPIHQSIKINSNNNQNFKIINEKNKQNYKYKFENNFNSNKIINDIVETINIDSPVNSSTKLLNNFGKSQGKYIGKCCEVKEKNKTRAISIKKPALNSYRLLSLKLIAHLDNNDDDNNFPSNKFIALKINNVSSIENADNKETKSLIDTTQVSLKNSANINHEFKDKINKRNRRQLKFIPVSSLTRKTNNSPSINPIFDANNINVRSNNSLAKFDPYFIRRILGVFDRMQPVFGDNFHSIPPGQFILAPTKYIDDAKLLPASFRFDSNNFQHEHNLHTQQQQQQRQQKQNEKEEEEEEQHEQRNNDGEKIFDQNPTGLGESKRLHTTGVEKMLVDENPIASVENNDDKSELIVNSFDQSNSTIETDDEKSMSERTKIISENNRDTVTRIEHQKYKLPETESRDTKLQRNSINNRDDLSAKYTFEYQVDDDKSNNFFGHRESRNGKITTGNYVVRLPNSKIQSVNYRVDENGYQAAVTYTTDNFNRGEMQP